MAQEIHVLNVRLPDEVIKWIDSLVKRGIYNSRSEAIRDFIRDHIRDHLEQIDVKGVKQTEAGK